MLALACLLSIFSISYAQQLRFNITDAERAQLNRKLPLLCPPGHELARVKITHQYNCNDYLNSTANLTSMGVAAILEENSFSNSQPAWMCQRLVTTRCRRRSNILPGSADDERPDVTWVSLLDPSECLVINKTGFAMREGTLHQLESSSKGTSNPTATPETAWPHTQTWECVDTANVLVVKTMITVDRERHMLSPSGSMASCTSYQAGACIRPDNTSIIWVPVKEEEQAWVPYAIFFFRGLKDVDGGPSRMIKADDNKFAAIWDGDEGYLTWKGCQKDLNFPCNEDILKFPQMFKLGSRYKIRRSKAGQRYLMLNEDEVQASARPETALSGLFRRVKREVKLTEPNQIASELQAVVIELQAEESRVLRSIMYQLCLKKEIDSQLVTAGASDEEGSTMLARKVTGLNNVRGIMSGDFLRVTACRPLEEGSWKFIPMNKTCTLEVPVKFEIVNPASFIDGTTHVKGLCYMNPRTRICSMKVTTAGCDDAVELVVDFDPPITLNGPTAQISPFLFKPLSLYPHYSRSTEARIVMVPEFYGIQMHLINQRPSWNDHAQFVEGLKKSIHRMEEDAGKKAGETTSDHKELVDTLWHSITIWGWIPSFSSNPLLRMWTILCNLFVSGQIFVQFVLPAGIAVAVWKCVGLGRAAGILYSKVSRRKEIKRRGDMRYNANEGRKSAPLLDTDEPI